MTPEVQAAAMPRLVAALDAAGAAVTVALLTVAVLGVAGPARLLLALAFVSFVPGWAVLGHMDALELLSRSALAVAVSLALCTAVAQALLWLRVWHPAAMLAGLALASLAVLASRLLRYPGRPR